MAAWYDPAADLLFQVVAFIMRMLKCAAALVFCLAASDAAFAGIHDFNGDQRIFSSQPTRIRKETVMFNGNYAPGTIIVNTAERRLYLVLPNGQALKYGIGVGRDGFTWAGNHRVTRKEEWPDWYPPEDMRRRVRGLPVHMKGGINNPLGARAIYLGSTLYRIHGSNEPETIGQAVSSGCFRMTNDDVIDLYDRVSVGAPVVVLK
jgi:lipoprotein-anchoring transpeptidase ErfK/SrfK